MARADDPPPSTALVRREDRPLDAGPQVQLDGPAAPVRRAMQAMLEHSVASYGDVVSALLVDLDQATTGLGELAWLARTMSIMEKEGAYRAALDQLHWWDRFLAHLPDPELLSERRQAEARRLRALRSRARIQAREDALREHRRRVEEELRGQELEEQELARWERIYLEPEGEEWRVDPDAWVEQALAELPPEEPEVPIVAEDLDAACSFSGFNAARAMRAHPELGPRARWMDQAIAASLQQELGLPPAEARAQAQVLTGMFWLALRRALGAGSHQLATSIRLFAIDPGSETRIQQQFTRELLLSWLHHLERLPPPPGRPALGGGFVAQLLGRAEPSPAPRQLTGGSTPSSPEGLWSRLRKGLKSGEDA